MGKIMFSGPSGEDGQDRVERGVSGFITEVTARRVFSSAVSIAGVSPD
jgi:hypothetical protein